MHLLMGGGGGYPIRTCPLIWIYLYLPAFKINVSSISCNFTNEEDREEAEGEGEEDSYVWFRSFNTIRLVLLILILTFMVMLQTIYVYGPCGKMNKWQKHTSHKAKTDDTHCNECIYINNIGKHFETVKRMWIRFVINYSMSCQLQ